MNNYSTELQKKIDELSSKKSTTNLGGLSFDSPLLLAPMSGICTAPFRLLMEELGAGGTVSELVSCHGINHGNQKTRDMLRIHKNEKNIGLQLFGEDPQSMAKAALVAQEYGPKFIDINMGCPVRKVVSKGGGSALMKDPKSLGRFFKVMKKDLKIPLTVKIRTGWDDDSQNADEIINIAFNEGLEFVAVHGRTRTQQYTGQARWNYLEEIAQASPLPLIGNGDLHTSFLVKERLRKTACNALMLGRGPLRNPFIFLESLSTQDESPFTAKDYWEIIQRLHEYTVEYVKRDRITLVQMRKHIVWFAAGLEKAAAFRGSIFQIDELSEVLKVTEDYFLTLDQAKKKIDHSKTFMAGGHG